MLLVRLGEDKREAWVMIVLMKFTSLGGSGCVI